MIAGAWGRFVRRETRRDRRLLLSLWLSLIIISFWGIEKMLT